MASHPSVYDQPPEDLRFQYEIVKHLADSVRQQTEAIGKISAQASEMLIRLERIEAKEVDARLVRLSDEVKMLRAESDQRKGANSVFRAVFRSPAVAWLFGAAVTIYAFITGVVHR